MEETQLVTFRLGNEIYGINISTVREIIKIVDIANVPKAPHFVSGLINLRGIIIPVVDLRKMFDIKPFGNSVDNRIIVVDANERSIGILVDNVSEVRNLNSAEVEPVPNIVSGIDNKYIDGVGKIDDQILILLRLDKVLCTENLMVTETVSE